jgi:hypothetical protein
VTRSAAPLGLGNVLGPIPRALPGADESLRLRRATHEFSGFVDFCPDCLLQAAAFMPPQLPSVRAYPNLPHPHCVRALRRAEARAPGNSRAQDPRSILPQRSLRTDIEAS